MREKRSKARQIDIELFDRRVDSGMTLKEVADKCGIAQSTLHNYEQGKSSPTIDTLEKILKVYGVSLDDFLGVETTEYKQDLEVFKKYRFSEAFFQQVLINNKSGIYKNERYFDIAKILNLLTEQPFFSFSIFEGLGLFFSDRQQEAAKRLINQFQTTSHIPFPNQTAQRMLLEPVVKALTELYTYMHLDETKDYLVQLRQQMAQEVKASQDSIVEEIRQQNKKRQQGD